MRQVVAGQSLTTTIENAPTGLVGIIGYRILDEDGAEVVARTTDGIVEYSASGFYVGESEPLTLPLGDYSALWDIDPGGVADPGNSASEQFQVVAGINLNPLPDADNAGTLCDLWFDPATLTAAVTGLSDEDALIYAQVASDILYHASLMAFPGLCPTTARPCSEDSVCGWWGRDWGSGYAWGPGSAAWSSLRACDCALRSRVLLPGPINEVSSVTVDGDTLTTDQWMLDGEDLVRTDGQAWPACQDMSAEDDATGSFTVHYIRGQVPPVLGQWAALELARWLTSAFPSAAACSIPSVVSGMQRQGVSFQFDREALAAAGLPMVDMFLKTYNPAGLQRPPMIWSPDLPKYAATH